VWGNLLEDAWRKGALTEAQRLQYAKGVAGFTIVGRDKVKAGVDQNINIEVRGKRCGSDGDRLNPYQSSSGPNGTRPNFGFIVKVAELTIGGVSVFDKPYSWYPAVDMNGWSNSGIPIHHLPVAGDYELKAQIVLRGDGDIWGTLGGMGADGELSESPTMGPVFEIELSRKVKVVGGDAELVRGVEDESKREAIIKSIVIQGAAIDSEGNFTCNMQFDHSPTALAFDVFLRDETGREWKVGSAVNNITGGVMGTTLGGFKLPGFTGKKGDLVFRSSRQVAEREPRMTEYWKGEIVVKGVDIGRP